MDFKEIQELIRLIGKSNLSEFKMKDGEFELSIRTDKFISGKGVMVTPGSMSPMVSATPAPATPASAVSESPAHAPAESAKPETRTDAGDGNYLQIRSPMVGTFYRSASPDKPPYIKVGDLVEKGGVVCIIEAMKLFNEIESDVSGRVVKVMVEDAQPVEYDQVLFLVDPKG